MSSVKCHLKAKRKNMKKHFIDKYLAGFVTFYLICLLSYISVLKHCKAICSNTAKTYETQLTYSI